MPNDNQSEYQTEALSLDDAMRELYAIAPKFRLWPDGLEIFFLVSQMGMDKSRRMEAYDAMAKFQQRLARKLEADNICSQFVIPFGSTVGARVLLISPWSKRLKQCPDYVATAKVVWQSMDTSWGWRQEWLSFFKENREAVRQQWMTEGERVNLTSLPNPVTIYRGYNKPKGKLGLSWTLSKRIAGEIPLCARRGASNPWVITAHVNPRHVIAYLNEGSDEEEVIISPRNANVIADEPVKA